MPRVIGINCTFKKNAMKKYGMISDEPIGFNLIYFYAWKKILNKDKDSNKSAFS